MPSETYKPTRPEPSTLAGSRPCDLVIVGEGEDAFAGVGCADPEVVHPPGAAQGHPAFGVEAVIAQPVVAGSVSVGGWDGFRGGLVDLARGSALQRAVRAPFVVVLAELVELGLQLSGA
jgi:hypothetical protein